MARHRKLHENSPTSITTPSPLTDPSPRSFDEDHDVTNMDVHDFSPATPTRSSALPAEPFHVNQQQFPPAGSIPLPFWSDSDDMLQFLTSDFSHTWPVSVPVAQLHRSNCCSANGSMVSVLQDNSQREDAQGHQAMQQMSRLISTSSSNLTAEIQNTGITSSFLDTCLHVFFDKFIPSFPVLHKATFNVRESSHPLLLNIMALGSLFVGAKDAVPKGEALWRLAHTAVATNWKHLMATKGPWDACNGVQLLLTAVLGQTYALMSKNESLRLTCQTFHGLGFAWARQCGMFNMGRTPFAIPCLDAPEDEKVDLWKTWAALEVQNRSVLGHYVLDGHISQFSGYPASSRHVTNPFPLPASDAAFEARTADSWIQEMRSQDRTQISFREIFVSVFSPRSLHNERLSLSNFTLRIILEGLQSLVAEVQEAEGLPAVGTPVKTDIIYALLCIYHDQFQGSDSSIDRRELIIRWHSICLDLATPSTALCRKICATHGVEQSLHGTTRQDLETFDLFSWSQSSDGLRALLHAVSIQEIVETMPLRRLHAIHLPAAIFSVATIYSARCIAGRPSAAVPGDVRWECLWDSEVSDMTHPQKPDMQAFLSGTYSSQCGSTPTIKNLMYELNSLQITLNSISSRWGVSHEMDELLQKWVSIANGGNQMS